MQAKTRKSRRDVGLLFLKIALIAAASLAMPANFSIAMKNIFHQITAYLNA